MGHVQVVYSTWEVLLGVKRLTRTGYQSEVGRCSRIAFTFSTSNLILLIVIASDKILPLFFFSVHTVFVNYKFE